MKIKEILKETIEEEKEIQFVSRLLIREIFTEVKKEEQIREKLFLKGIHPGQPILELGKASNLIPIEKLNISDNLKEVLNQIEIVVNFGKEFSEIGGTYEDETKIIELNLPQGYENDKDGAISIMVHELRHALDDFYSGGWALYSAPKRSINKDFEDYEYFGAPYEINARMSQLFNRIRQILKKRKFKSEKEFLNYISPLLKNYYLSSDLFKTEKEKDYQQLIKRIVKFYHEIST